MKRLVLALSVVAMSATAGLAVDDPIASRKALMQSNGAAAAVAGGMMKQQLEYNPVVAKSVIATLNATSHAFGAFFPDGSDMGSNTTASPKIWEDMGGFEAAVAKFETDTAAAMEAAGRDGPADLAAFQAAIGPILGNCKSCHEAYRVQN